MNLIDFETIVHLILFGNLLSSLILIFRDVVKESQDNTKEARQNTLDDAVGIYNKFVSMEAITPLGFSSIVRSVF